jgi:hypothetical protein
VKIESRIDRGQKDPKTITDLRSKESENDEIRGAIR